LERAFVYNPEKISIPQQDISQDEVEHEIARYREALNKVKLQLEEEKTRVRDQLGRTEPDIFSSHIMITEDPFFIDEVPSLISAKRKNAAWIITEGLSVYINTFKEIDDTFFRERDRDIEDVAWRVVRALIKEKETDILLRTRGIFVVRELTPSMLMRINPRKVKGIISESGGETSHAVILAKSLFIPTVINVKKITTKVETGVKMIVDGHTGEVIINPTPEIKEKYIKLENKYHIEERKLFRIRRLSSVTRDNRKILLSANIERIEDLHPVRKFGAEGIGLFRTELPFILHNHLLTEDEQFEIYRTVVRGIKNRPVTIRTLDIGGDKFFPFIESLHIKDPNPFLGVRSVRLCLQKPDIFRIQIRAILRASYYGYVNIIIPMISSCEEMEKVNKIIDEEKESLSREKLRWGEPAKIGAMIEIPSAALITEHLILMCDFFSIGTNDLIQYTLAVDRTNNAVSDYYVPENPAVLKLIQFTAQAEERAGKHCSLCGELAGNPLFTSFFIGMGIKELSMEPHLIPRIKKTLRSFTMEEAKSLAFSLLKQSSIENIKKELRLFYQRHINEPSSP